MDKKTKATIFSGMVLLVSAAAQAEPAETQAPPKTEGSSNAAGTPSVLGDLGNILNPLGLTTFSVHGRYPQINMEGPGGGAGDVESGDVDADDGE